MHAAGHSSAASMTAISRSDGTDIVPASPSGSSWSPSRTYAMSAAKYVYVPSERTTTRSLSSPKRVVGAQTAVTSTLGSVVSNVVVLTTTLIAMAALEWRLTLLALVVLPMFHANGWGFPFSGPAAGAKLVFPGRHHDGRSLADLINTEGVNLAAGAGTAAVPLVHHCSMPTRPISAASLACGC